METIEALTARVDVVEAKMATLATKEDLANLKAEVYKAIGEQTWKLVTFVAGINGLLVAGVYFVARFTHIG